MIAACTRGLKGIAALLLLSAHPLLELFNFDIDVQNILSRDDGMGSLISKDPKVAMSEGLRTSHQFRRIPSLVSKDSNIVNMLKIGELYPPITNEEKLRTYKRDSVQIVFLA